MTKKIIVLFLSIFIIFSFSQVNLAAKEPGADASKKTITNWLEKNYATEVSIDKLVKWYKKVTDNTARDKIYLALEKKSGTQVNDYVKKFSESELAKNVPKELITILHDNLYKGEEQEGIFTSGATQLKNWDWTESADKLTEAKRQVESAEADIVNPIEKQSTYKPKSDDLSGSKVLKKAGTALAIVRTTGVIITVLMTMILGFKYVTGSIEEKAQYKQDMLPYLIGTFLIFCGTVVSQAIYVAVK